LASPTPPGNQAARPDAAAPVERGPAAGAQRHRTNEYFRAVALDYDGTLTGAEEHPTADVLEAVAEAREQGCRVILVTGRILEELREVFPTCDRSFDAVVAENGAVLSIDGTTRVLAPPVEFELDQALVDRGVPFRRGSVLLATLEAHAAEVQQEIRLLGLECQLIRNRTQLMVLPSGISKGFGVAQVLTELGLSLHNAIAIGDGENDHSLLGGCEIGVSVANAVEGLRRHADLVLPEPGGAGVAKFLRGPLLRGDSRLDSRRWSVEIGRSPEKGRITLPGSRVNLLVTGRSQSGKSHFVGMLAEQLIGLGYSLCVIDPEGEYGPLGALRGVLQLDASRSVPPADRIGWLIEHRSGGVLVDLSPVDAQQRSSYVAQLLRRLQAERSATGLPHWILCDEAHEHFGHDGPLARLLSSSFKGVCLVTYRPHDLDEASRRAIDYVVALPGGKDPEGGAPDPFAELERLYQLDLGGWSADAAEALLAQPRAAVPPQRFLIHPRQTTHVRHWHKYVGGRLPAERCFAFRTESGALRAVSANVAELHHVVRSCDAGVLRHHAGRHDLSRWLREAIQDEDLARDVHRIEQEFVESPRSNDDAEQLRTAVICAIERRYGD
jgi:hydroxymethylpyrimidine pyrophosphatase-like HAD family hydrolase